MRGHNEIKLGIRIPRNDGVLNFSLD